MFSLIPGGQSARTTSISPDMTRGIAMVRYLLGRCRQNDHKGKKAMHRLVFAWAILAIMFAACVESPDHSGDPQRPGASQAQGTRAQNQSETSSPPACSGLNESDCAARSDCAAGYRGFCDCTCPGPTGYKEGRGCTEYEGGGCADCSESCFVFAACVAESPATPLCSGSGPFACGSGTCSAGEFCEILQSDIPEFNDSYTRYQCRPIPGCGSGINCACLESVERCHGSYQVVSGTCSQLPTGDFTLRCDIGG
jgi:hypothetical protein